MCKALFISLFFLLCVGLVGSVRGNTAVTFGVSVHGFSHVEGVAVEQSNSSWVRSDVFYNGSFYLGTEQNDVLGYRGYGQKVLAILDCWTMGLNQSFTIGDWDSRVSAAVDFYDGLVEAFEVWNEPNVFEYQYGYLNDSDAVGRYFDMLRNASEIIKAHDGSLVVVGGALSDIYDYWAGDDWEDWFEPLLDKGANDYVDVWSVHLYAESKEEYALGKIRELSGKPVWVTEVGYSVAQGEEYQAEWLDAHLGNIVGSAVLPDLVFVYTLTGDYGLLSGNGSKRASYFVFLEYAFGGGSGVVVAGKWYDDPLKFGTVVGIIFFAVLVMLWLAGKR